LSLYHNLNFRIRTTILMTYQTDYAKYGIVLGSVSSILIGISTIVVALSLIISSSLTLYILIKNNATLINPYISLIIAIASSIFFIYLGIVLIRVGFQYKNFRSVEYVLINSGVNSFSIGLILLGIAMLVSSQIFKIFIIPLNTYGVYLIVSGVLFLIGCKITLMRNIVGPILIIVASIVLGSGVGFNTFIVGIVIISVAIFLRFISRAYIIDVLSLILTCIGVILVGTYFATMGSRLLSIVRFLNVKYIIALGQVVGVLNIIGGIMLIIAPILITVDIIVNKYSKGSYMYGRW